MERITDSKFEKFEKNKIKNLYGIIGGRFYTGQSAQGCHDTAENTRVEVKDEEGKGTGVYVNIYDNICWDCSQSGVDSLAVQFPGPCW